MLFLRKNIYCNIFFILCYKIKKLFINYSKSPSFLCKGNGKVSKIKKKFFYDL